MRGPPHAPFDPLHDSLVAPFNAGDAPEAAAGDLRADTKVRKGTPRVVLLRSLGEVAEGEGWSHEVSEDVLAAALAEGLGVAT